MIVKIYALIWLLGALTVGILYLTGNFSPVTAIIFGFLSFTAIFMGMMGVLPVTEVNHVPLKH